MSKKYVWVVGGSSSYYRPFTAFGEYVEDKFAYKIKDQDMTKLISLVLFTGGEDIGPSLYNEKPGSKTYFNPFRDMEEIKAFQRAAHFNLPMVGVCRGAQFLSVMSGGKLVQHVTGHSGNHSMDLWDGRTITVSSCHHQMQLPPESAKIIGWATNKQSSVYLNGNDEPIHMEKEIEVVHYPTINALGMQHHPEFMNSESDGFKIAAELVETFLKVPRIK